VSKIATIATNVVLALTALSIVLIGPFMVYMGVWHVMVSQYWCEMTPDPVMVAFIIMGVIFTLGCVYAVVYMIKEEIEREQERKADAADWDEEMAAAEKRYAR